MFPAIQSGVDAAVETYESRGVDVTPFTELAETEGATFLFPITDYGAQITSILTNALENVFINDAEVENVLSAIRKLIVEGRPEPQREPPPSPFLLTPALRVGGEGSPAPLEPLILSAPIVAPASAPTAPQFS